MEAFYPSTGTRAKTISRFARLHRRACTLGTTLPKREPMEDADLQALTAKLELLIQRVERLKAQNRLLLESEQAWREERAHLIEKNEIARHKVESMISRLKALEQDS